MDEFDDVVDADEPQATNGTENADIWPDSAKAEIQKLRDEAAQYRREADRVRLAKDFGDDVLDLVPETLKPKEQRELAEKIATRFGAQQPIQTETVETPPQVEPTEAEQNLAAVAKGPESAGTPSTFTPEEALARAKADPSWLARELSAGRNPLPPLNIGKDRVQSDWEP